ncbi:hypothetical protein GRF29_28g2197663 [Pseudopithomyces chartarum]|uniref:Major facilitator superfamily (MFS) profile domain-containing protein n=1 Tax=Pseudopithomyces chartarum TaxID=1892770 RepID=A0AAN6M3T8_9PLEO|nr:hypothetical protein GRF29_28g2197663 [Pseudopithomyces chartarum]
MASDAIELETRNSTSLNPAVTQAKQDDSQETTSIATIVAHTSQYQHPKGLRLVLLTLGLMLSILLAALDFSIIATAIPSITTEFGSIANIAWYGSAYSVTNSSFKLVWGKAYQYFPLKPVFLLTVVIFEVGNVICGAAKSSEILILGRVVSGLGGGGVMTGAFIIIAVSVEDRYRAAYMGVDQSSDWWSGGGDHDLNVSLADYPPGHEIARSHPGAGLGGRRSRYVVPNLLRACDALFHLVGSALSFAAFVYDQHLMRDKAMVHAHLVRKPDILLNLIYSFFLAGLFFPLQYTLPIQFQSVDATSASQSGVRLIPLILGVSVFTAVSNGALTWWHYYKPFLLIGAFLATAGTASIYSVDSPASTRTWIGFELLTGMGVGLALQIPMIYNQALVQRDDIPSVTSLSLFTENLGTTLFVASAEASFQQGLVNHLKDKMPSLDPHTVVDAGVTQIRTMFGGQELETVLGSYLYGCRPEKNPMD